MSFDFILFSHTINILHFKGTLENIIIPKIIWSSAHMFFIFCFITNHINIYIKCKDDF